MKGLAFPTRETNSASATSWIELLLRHPPSRLQASPTVEGVDPQFRRVRIRNLPKLVMSGMRPFPFCERAVQ